MNDNSPTTIHKWLKHASTSLKAAEIDSYHLDALILLEHVTGWDRAYILAHYEHVLNHGQLEQLTQYLKRRVSREPLAYIVGSIEFYGRNFLVDNRVLVPRPESEALVEALHSLPIKHEHNLLDIGTGSGILGISAKLEFPNLDVTLSDVSQHALNVAALNAQKLEVKVKTIKSYLLEAFLSNQQSTFDIIMANLPYVDRAWPTSPELQYEPQNALFADDNGLELVKRLITQSNHVLRSHGYLILEADPSQFSEITTFSKGHQLAERARNGYCLILKKA